MSNRTTWQQLAPAKAAKQLRSFQIVDVRQPGEFVGPLSHVDGAILMPLDLLVRWLDRLDPKAPTLVICRSGNRSARGCEVLTSQGFSNVFNLDGGMNRWHAESLPVANPQTESRAW